MEKFFTPFNPQALPDSQIKLSGEWTVWCNKDLILF
jgi:hypothetical protein